jgi:hypothetical protein
MRARVPHAHTMRTPCAHHAHTMRTPCAHHAHAMRHAPPTPTPTCAPRLRSGQTSLHRMAPAAHRTPAHQRTSAPAHHRRRHRYCSVTSGWQGAGAPGAILLLALRRLPFSFSRTGGGGRRGCCSVLAVRGGRSQPTQHARSLSAGARHAYRHRVWVRVRRFGGSAETSAGSGTRHPLPPPLSLSSRTPAHDDSRRLSSGTAVSTRVAAVPTSRNFRAHTSGPVTPAAKPPPLTSSPLR